MGQPESGLALAWRAFIEQGELNPVNIKPVIAESWERSRAYGISPHAINSNDILEASKLKARQEAARSLLAPSTKAMEDLHLTLRGLGFTVVLTDFDGYILKTVGDADFLTKAQQICLSNGANWSEQVKGTNAIGTALQTGEAVNVYAWEHYCQENHFITCSAAPIKGTAGELLGILDVTGDFRGGNERLLHLVSMAAKNIEKELVLIDLLGKYNISKQKNEILNEVISEGLLTIGKDGLINEMNPMATKLLGYKAQDCLGKPVAEIINSQKLWCFNSHDFSGEVTINGQGEKRLQTRAQRILDEDGKHISTIATLKLVNNAKTEKAVTSDAQSLRYSFERIMGTSTALEQAIARAKRAAHSHSTLLIQGETGTGKELFAQSIHQESPCQDGPFVAINCGAIPKELVESELFGYEEGAFTGARRGGGIGKFELANGGTLFLDEIGDMPLMAQTALLRVLQEKQIIRVGGRKVIPVKVRVIAATHRSLEQLVEQGNFRRDLYYRLNVVDIQIPPLRERSEDVLELAEYFLDKYCAENGRTGLRLSAAATRCFLTYSWPGNIRELENIIEGLVNLVDGDEVLPADLPVNLQNQHDSGVLYLDQGRAAQEIVPVVSLKEMERQAIIRALQESKGNISVAAQALEIGRNTLHRKLKEYKIS